MRLHGTRAEYWGDQLGKMFHHSLPLAFDGIPERPTDLEVPRVHPVYRICRPIPTFRGVFWCFWANPIVSRTPMCDCSEGRRTLSSRPHDTPVIGRCAEYLQKIEDVGQHYVLRPMRVSLGRSNHRPADHCDLTSYVV